jgi:uncharacterized phage-associated protein
MANFSASVIANEFLRRRASEQWPQQMQLHKLAYIAHGWNLAINDEPLITEQPEAWDNGPVYRSLWDHIRDFGYGKPNCTLIDPLSKEPISAVLSASESDIIDHVWKRFKIYSAIELSEMTHQPGTPWFNAYFRRGRNSSLHNVEIRDYYIQLAKAGRAQNDGKAA